MAFRIPKGVDIFLTQQKYEGVLRNHSQYVRWLRAQTCFCIDSISKMPDVGCVYCHGRGKVYSAQTTLRVSGEESPHAGASVMPKNCPIVQVHSVARTAFNQRQYYTVSGFTQSEITIAVPSMSGMTLPTWQETIETDYTYSIAKTYREVVTYAGNYLLELRGLPSQTLVYGSQTIQSDVVKVISLYNLTKSKTITASEWSRNFIFISESTVAGDLAVNDEIQVVCEYIRPFQFALLSVSEKMMWQDAYAITGAQAIGIVPYNTQVGIGDLLTQAAGESRGEEVITYLTGQTDYELAAFDVVRIVAIKDITGNQYVEGVHYQRYKRNHIKFIHSTIHPTNGAKFSIQYMYNPTFVVMPDKPLVRSGENQVFPRRVNLTVFDKVSPLFDGNIVAKIA